MIGFRKLVLAALFAVSACFLPPQGVRAFELTGAWTTSGDQCKKVFARKGRANQVDFTGFSSANGGGFIAEADRLRGKVQNCAIRLKKESDQIVNLVAACGSGTVFSYVQFFLKVLDDDTLSREFPGIDGMEVKYHRCRI